MTLLLKTLPFILMIFFIVSAGQSNITLYLIKPVFDSTSIGASTDPDERAEFNEMITGHCNKIFKAEVVAVDRYGLHELKEKKVDFLIWDIEHYHFFYDDQEHIPCIQATLYRFSNSNNYTMPIVAVSPPKVTGEAAYGIMAPFREGIDANFKMIKKMYKNGCSGKSVVPQITAEMILEKDPLRNASSKVFVLVSPLNDATIGNVPADYEVFHLPGMIAHYVGELLKKQPVLIGNELLSRIKNQSIDVKIARVDLRHYGDDDNELTLTIYQSSDIERATFSVSVKDPRRENWRMNDEFQLGLEKIFKIISQNMEYKK